MSVQAGESYRFEQRVRFDGFQHPINNGGECLIRRGSDGLYWDGSTYVVAETWLSTTVEAGIHYYDWIVPPTAQSGDTYLFKIRLANDPNTEAGGNMVVREEGSGSGGGDTFIYPINVFDD